MKHKVEIITTSRKALADPYCLGFNGSGFICSEFAKKYFDAPVEKQKRFKVSLSTQPFKGAKEIKLASSGWVPNKGGSPRYIYNELRSVLEKIGATKRVFVKIEKHIDKSR